MIEFQVGGQAAIELSGEIDMANADEVLRNVSDALDGAPTELVLHMGRVTFIDSTGLSCLLTARRTCDARNVRFAIADPSHTVMRLLTVTALDSAFEIRHS